MDGWLFLNIFSVSNFSMKRCKNNRDYIGNFRALIDDPLKIPNRFLTYRRGVPEKGLKLRSMEERGLFGK